MIETLLSIDLGTSSLKASLFDTAGNLLARSFRGYPVIYPEPGWAEQQPETWWQACCECCRELPYDLLQGLKSICLSGQAPGCVPIDIHGEALRQAILWLDRRSASQATWLRDRLGIEQAVQTGGNTLDSYFGGVKWLWLRQNEPEVYQRTWKILQPSGYLIHHLTGKVVIDWGHAGICSPCFNLENRTWDAPTCNLMGLDPGKLPEIHSPSSVIGLVSKGGSLASGLPEGTPVVCGAPDYICSCLGSGAMQPGSTSLMLGTAGNLMIPFMPCVDPRLLNSLYVEGSLIGCGGVMAGGAVTWFKEMLGLDLPDPLSILEREAAEIPAGSDNLIFLPSLLGERSPYWDPNARGVFFGLTPTHTRAHLYHAVLEGVAYAIRLLVEIAKENGINPHEVIAINGGARSPLWRQILADVIGVPICWRPEKDGTSLGAAALAAAGTGIISNLDGISPWLETPVNSQPDLSNCAIYDRLYPIYSGLYERLKEPFSALQDHSSA